LIWILPVGSFTAAVAVTWIVLVLSRRFGRLDEPREHSSHTTAMPTAGGLGIVSGFWTGIFIAWATDWSHFEVLVPWVLPMSACSVVLALMLVDDVVRPLRVWEKTAIQLAVGTVWVQAGAQFEMIEIPFTTVDLSGIGWVFSILWIASICNVYNFMDGIDGISASQAICMSFFAVLLFRRAESDLWVLPLALGCSALGFLVFNRPPGRIFMGDVGSMFLGFVVAVLGIFAQGVGISFWIFSLLLGYFFFDTGYTVFRRALRRENILIGHRKHLYQRLNKLGWSHLRIDLVALTLTSHFGAAALFFQAGENLPGVCLVGIAVAVLVVIAIWVERKDPAFA
jgi:UDP-GlcNAc:undecaprenyl-phosphate GlcNAc-1-phosphate transferase